MKNFKKGISLLAVIAFLITALIPVSGLAASGDSMVQYSVNSGSAVASGSSTVPIGIALNQSVAVTGGKEAAAGGWEADTSGSWSSSTNVDTSTQVWTPATNTVGSTANTWTANGQSSGVAVTVNTCALVANNVSAVSTIDPEAASPKLDAAWSKESDGSDPATTAPTEAGVDHYKWTLTNATFDSENAALSNGGTVDGATWTTNGDAAAALTIPAGAIKVAAGTTGVVTVKCVAQSSGSDDIGNEATIATLAITAVPASITLNDTDGNGTPAGSTDTIDVYDGIKPRAYLKIASLSKIPASSGTTTVTFQLVSSTAEAIPNAIQTLLDGQTNLLQRVTTDDPESLTLNLPTFDTAAYDAIAKCPALAIQATIQEGNNPATTVRNSGHYIQLRAVEGTAVLGWSTTASQHPVSVWANNQNVNYTLAWTGAPPTTTPDNGWSYAWSASPATGVTFGSTSVAAGTLTNTIKFASPTVTTVSATATLNSGAAWTTPPKTATATQQVTAYSFGLKETESSLEMNPTSVQSVTITPQWNNDTTTVSKAPTGAANVDPTPSVGAPAAVLQNDGTYRITVPAGKSGTFTYTFNPDFNGATQTKAVTYTLTVNGPTVNPNPIVLTEAGEGTTITANVENWPASISNVTVDLVVDPSGSNYQLSNLPGTVANGVLTVEVPTGGTLDTIIGAVGSDPSDSMVGTMTIKDSNGTAIASDVPVLWVMEGVPTITVTRTQTLSPRTQATITGTVTNWTSTQAAGHTYTLTNVDGAALSLSNLNGTVSNGTLTLTIPAKSLTASVLTTLGRTARDFKLTATPGSVNFAGTISMKAAEIPQLESPDTVQLPSPVTSGEIPLTWATGTAPAAGRDISSWRAVTTNSDPVTAPAITWGTVTTSGVTGTVTIPSGVADGTQYTYTVQMQDGSQDAVGTAVTVTVIVGATGASITTQPTNQSVTAPATATFTVAATNATGYQWQVKKGNADWTNCAAADGTGATTASFTTVATTTAMSGYQYRCIVSGPEGTQPVNSTAATLTVTSGDTPTPPGEETITLNPTPLPIENQPVTITAPTDLPNGTKVTLTISPDGGTPVEVEGTVQNGAATFQIPADKVTTLLANTEAGKIATIPATIKREDGTVVDGVTNISITKPDAENLVDTEGTSPVPITNGTVTLSAGVQTQDAVVVNVIGSDGKAISGNWDNEVTVDSYPTGIAASSVQPQVTKDPTTGNLTVTVPLGTAPGVYTITFTPTTPAGRAAAGQPITLTINVNAIQIGTGPVYGTASGLSLGDTVRLTAWTSTGQALTAGTWAGITDFASFAAGSSASSNPTDITITTPLAGTNRVTYTQGGTIWLALLTTDAAPVTGISYAVQIADDSSVGTYPENAPDGKLPGQVDKGWPNPAPAQPMWHQLVTPGSTVDVAPQQIQVDANSRFEIYVPSSFVGVPSTAGPDAANQDPKNDFLQWEYKTSGSVAGGNELAIPRGQGFYGITTRLLTSGPVTADMDGWQFRLVRRQNDVDPTNWERSPWITLRVTDADLTVEVPEVVISSAPASTQGNTIVPVTETGNVTFTTSIQNGLASADLSYQWQSRVARTAEVPNPSWVNVENGENVTGATERTLTLTNVPSSQNNVEYRCLVRNNSFSNIQGTSNVLRLQVNSVPGAVVINAPTVATVLFRYASRTASFTVDATTNNGDAVSYQWYRRASIAPIETDEVITTPAQAAAYLAAHPTSLTAISGATSAEYTTDALKEGVYEYSCQVTNTSNTTLTATAPSFYVLVTQRSRIPKITVPNAETDTNLGATSGSNVTMECEAAVQSQEPLTYQWQASQSANGPWSDLAGATSATLTLQNVDGRYNQWFFHCVVKNTAANTQTVSAPYALTVWNAANVPVVSDIVLTQDEDSKRPELISRAYAPTHAALNYTWYYNGDIVFDSDGNQLAGLAQPNENGVCEAGVIGPSDGAWKCEWTNNSTNTTSDWRKPYAETREYDYGTVPQDLIVVQPTDTTAAVGQTASFSVGAQLNETGNTPIPGELVYIWQRSQDGGTTWTNCTADDGSGQFTMTFSVPMTQAAFEYATAANMQGYGNPFTYRVNVANRTTGQYAYSDAVELTVTSGTEVTPAISVKDGVENLAISDNADLGKILSGTALTVTKDGHKVSEVQDMVTFAPANAAYQLRFVNAEGTALTADNVVGTGCKIQLIDTADGDKVLNTVTIVVRGDVNGSGVISLTQLVRMAAGFKDATQLNALYTLAGDLDDSGAINLTDLVQEAAIYRAQILDAGTPSPVPTTEPTAQPSTEPTAEPTTAPTAEPTAAPTTEPTAEPTTQPTAAPTATPTASPSAAA